MLLLLLRNQGPVVIQPVFEATPRARYVQRLSTGRLGGSVDAANVNRLGFSTARVKPGRIGETQ